LSRPDTILLFLPIAYCLLPFLPHQSKVKIQNPVFRCEFFVYPNSRQISIDSRKESGYIIARMRYEIVFAPEAVQDYKRLSARERSSVRDSLERHLRYEPERISKSRIKRLRGVRKPQYRLRIDEIRVFYDAKENTVEILAIIPKSRAAAWLEQKGVKK